MSGSRKLSLISLGCPKNLVDSEEMVSGFLSHDMDVVVDPADADVVVVNTCGFLGSAREESVATIRKVAKLKQDGLKALFVTGCMVGHYADEIHEAVPEVDRLIDFKDYSRLNELVDEILPAPAATGGLLQPGRHVEARLTPAHFAYLKISEGCNHTCSFCVIPKIRGRMRSSPLEDLLGRAERLAELGAKEINVVAQDSTMYGIDLYGRMRIVELLQRLAALDSVHWVRLLYAYPTEVSDELIDVLANHGGALLPYIDVPLQHTSERMLRAMNRKSSEECVETMMVKLRQANDDLVIRTTFIVGFPGETEEDFRHMLDFVERHRIDRVGAFLYSHEEGSPAADLDDQIEPEVARERLDRLMTLQNRIAAERNERWVGREIDVLVDDPAEDGEGALGRSPADAPEVDGKVLIRGAHPRAGAVVRVRVTGAGAYDLEAEPV